jgi:hypothetical protein
MSTRTSQRVDRSASLNTTRRSQGRISRDQGGATVVGTGISFTAPDTIADSGNGLAAMGVNAQIEVRGSPKNSRVFDVVTSAAGTLTVRPALVTSEAAGASITITRKD